jgi:hypothetical protein
MAIPRSDLDDLPAAGHRAKTRRGTGLLWGLFYGLVPHTFCILFIVFSVAGATMASTLVSRVLFVPYLFEIVVALSFFSAALSGLLYLRRNGLLSWRGARRKWRYLGGMFGATLAVNLLFFWVVFPAMANLDLTAPASAQAPASQGADGAALDVTTLRVAIPCPGHAPLVVGELRGAPGIRTVRYEGPDLFRVEYDPAATTLEGILALPVFEAFPAEIVA